MQTHRLSVLKRLMLKVSLMSTLGGALVLGVVASGCASNGAANGTAEGATAVTEREAVKSAYPTAERLVEIAKLPAASLAQRQLAEVEQFSLDGPLPEIAVGAPMGDPDVVQTWLQEKLGTKSVLLTANAHCVAHQTGTYLRLHEQKFPGRRTSAFISERCGEVAGRTSLNTFGWASGVEKKTNEELLEMAKESLDKLAGQTFPDGTSVGLALVRFEGGAKFVMAATVPTLAIEPFQLRAVDNVVTFTGEVRQPFIQLSAYVTQGEFGGERCSFDASITLPKFRVTCTVLPTDSVARVVVFGARDDDFFSNRVLTARVLPSDDDGRDYVQRAIEVNTDLDPKSPKAFLAAVNTVRLQAGLKPMSLAPLQSTTAAGLAQHAGAEQTGPDQRQIYNDIFKGMLAGWDLEEGFVIENANVFVEVIGRGKDGVRAVDLLSSAMEVPSSRIGLMKPDARRLAIGIKAADDESVMSGLIGIYDPFLDGDYDTKAQDEMIARVNRVRKARGLEPHTIHPPFQEAAERAARRARSGSSSTAAMKGMLKDASKQSNASVVGFVSQAQDVESIVIPAYLLTEHAHEIGLSVEFVRLTGTRWGKTTAFFVAFGASTSGMVAQGDAPTSPPPPKTPRRPTVASATLDR